MKSKKIKIIALVILFSSVFAGVNTAFAPSTYAQATEPKLRFNDGKGKAGDHCGAGEDKVSTKFNFGCQGDNYKGPGGAIGDMLFTFIRFISTGVGLIVIASVIFSGIQYSASQGNPEATVKAKSRIQSAIIGLALYMFLFALMQWFVPGGLFAG